MEFINMTSTGKATIEVDVKEFNFMLFAYRTMFMFDKNGNVLKNNCTAYNTYKEQMEQANNFEE